MGTIRGPQRMKLSRMLQRYTSRIDACLILSDVFLSTIN